MADSRFFTNTYITGSGRQNYLRIDNLEDPLFTSFTFDIDFTTSPLFYTISDYDYPNDIGLPKKIEDAINAMYKTYMGTDSGYDILPLLSANFLDGGKMGFGLQQNIYTDLPLYGAAEYIYMVDKRNGDGSQNDVRYDTLSGGNPNAANSYKLGDSVKEAVSASDKAWADKEKQNAKEQIKASEDIINDEREKERYDDAKKLMDSSLDAYNKVTESVKIKDANGKEVTIEMTEEELQKKVNELKQIDKEYEQLKRDIASYVNDELSAFRNKATTIFNRNKCITEVMSDSYDRAKIVEKYGDDFPITELGESMEIKNDNGTFLSEMLKLYNNLETYERSFDDSRFKENDGKSLLIEKFESDGCVTVRPSKLNNKFGKRIENLDLTLADEKSDDKDGRRVVIKAEGEGPNWSYGLAERVAGLSDYTPKTGFIKIIVEEPLKYTCDIESSFENFTSKKIEDNEELLAIYDGALDEIKFTLYGYVEGGEFDKSNPSPDSVYGQYLAAKEECENTAYAQAQKTLQVAQNKYDEMDNMMGGESSGQMTLDDYINEINKETNLPVVSEMVYMDEATGSGISNVAPQTVLDMLGFISGMKKMTREYPYIINAITGLDKAYENHYGIKDPYMGSGDNKIVLTCWESIDLRVSSMFNRYYNAVYDRQYRRERVPVNLRRFNCSIYVHDVRNFVTRNNIGNVNRIFELTDMYYSVIEFRFYDCEIVTGETGNIFNDISNEAPSEMKKTNFTFTYGNCVVNFVPNSEVKTH